MTVSVGYGANDSGCVLLLSFDVHLMFVSLFFI